MAGIEIQLTDKSRINDPNWNELGFGRYFSDHMFITRYTKGEWDNGEILPYGPLLIEPGMCTLHYGQTIFEGLKAFRDVRGGANLFRPIMNARRLNNSADRLCIPRYDELKLIDSMIELIKIDKNWIPKVKGQSLYIRPVAFGSGNFLGVQASESYILCVMTSPVSSYYPEGLNPVRIMIADDYVRAVRGGLGSAKTAANYAASLLAAKKAKEKGFAQVLWLDGVSREFVDEVGAMNIMFVIDNELITPPLTQDSILAGVTRDTVLTLAKEWGMKVSERSITMNDVDNANHAGTLQEVFGTGTAAVISPVGVLNFKNEDIVVNGNKIGPVAQKMYDYITGIQCGEIEDTHNWNVHFDL